MEGQIEQVEPQLLTEREQFAFQKHLKERQYPIAPVTAIKMFELYLAGKSCEDIRRLNPQFTLGQIVHARIEHEWDRQLKEYRDSLYSNARKYMEQVVMETTLTMGRILTAKNRVYEEKIAKYLQTGDETHLADLGLGGIDGYRKVVETLQKLTGQDQVKSVKGEIIHRPGVPEGPRATTPQQAEAIVAALLESGSGT